MFPYSSFCALYGCELILFFTSSCSSQGESVGISERMEKRKILVRLECKSEIVDKMSGEHLLQEN